MSKTPTIREQIDQLLDDAYSMGVTDRTLVTDDYHTLMPNIKEKAESLISQSVIEELEAINNHSVSTQWIPNEDNFTIEEKWARVSDIKEYIKERIEKLKTLANKGGK